MQWKVKLLFLFLGECFSLKDVIKVIYWHTVNPSISLPPPLSPPVSGPLTYQGFLSACLQVCGSFQTAGVAWQRTFSNQPWQWWNTSGTVQELQWNTQWWECWLRPWVYVCASLYLSGSRFLERRTQAHLMSDALNLHKCLEKTCSWPNTGCTRWVPESIFGKRVLVSKKQSVTEGCHNQSINWWVDQNKVSQPTIVNID